MNHFIIALLCCFAIINASPLEDQGDGLQDRGICETGWTFLAQTGYCYKYDPTGTSWTEATKTCQKDHPSASLVSIHDKITNDFLNTLMNVRTWTGGYLNSKRQWSWTDGSAWDYTNWYPEQPDNWKGVEDVLQILENNRGWNDEAKSQKCGSLCQYKPTSCLPGYRHWGGNCFKFVDRTCTWEEAESFCRHSSGGKAALASIGSSAENRFILSLFPYKYKGFNNAWIGGTYLTTNRWAWIDGHKWNGYTNWNRGEPNNFQGHGQARRRENKIFMYGPGNPPTRPSGTWNDEPDTNPKRQVTGMVCEHRA